MITRNWLMACCFVFCLSACNQFSPGTPVITPTEPVRTTPTAEVAATLAPSTPTATVEQPELSEEAILILEPGNGSRVSNPLRVYGIANPTFEQNLVVVLISEEGERLATVPAQIAADLGQRGPFQVQVPFEGEGQAFIQVYDASARDGGIVHLASVGVTLVPAGQEDILTSQPHPERIAIFQPELRDTVQGGRVRVEGFGLANFEQTLVIEVQDQDGRVVASQPVMVNATELGQPGPFSADIPYQIDSPGPGRIAVRDISPAFGGDVHVASVEVLLEP